MFRLVWVWLSLSVVSLAILGSFLFVGSQFLEALSDTNRVIAVCIIAILFIFWFMAGTAFERWGERKK